MKDACRWLLGGSLLAGSLFGCSAATEDSEHVAVAREALSVCDETVPANRNVDGFPAYAQCAASMNSAIYSNNGIDTSLTQMGSDWVRTQYSGGYQCTEFAHRYLMFKWKVTWEPNGNAGTWCDTVPPSTSGLVQTMTPVHGDLMVFAPGSCGADKVAGHVNVVNVVGTQLTNVEQNGARRGNYQASCAKCFLHVVANDGTSSGAAGAAGTSGSAGMNGATPGTGGTRAGSAGTSAGPTGPVAQAGAPSSPSPTTPPVTTTPPMTTSGPAMMTSTPASTPISGAAGASVVTPTTAVVPSMRPPDNEGTGCSVRRAGAVNHGAAQIGGLWVLALIGLRVTRRQKRAA